jgi:hypothetical protein
MNSLMATTAKTVRRHGRPAAAMLVCLAAVLAARPPEPLPGVEITDEQYLDYVLPRDSVVAATPRSSPASPTWLERAAKTWAAPPLPEQLAADEHTMLMGMGAVFVPRMSSARLEPDVEILDAKGEVAARGRTGRKYSLLPGNYYVMLGSGPHNVRIVKPAVVTEGETRPLVPDWCGLSIDVLDQNSVPFRGEYEIARMDDLEPFGRGYGRNEELGEKVKTWILPPGTYKVFGVGQSYNTMTNFVTVRLVPGEFVRFVLVQDPDQLTILGGGAVTSEVTTAISSNWRYGVDLGGTADFNATTDHMSESERNTASQTALSLLSNMRLNYDKSPIEWKTRLRANFGMTFTGDTAYERPLLEADPDELRLSSVFTWRLINWLGPYGRVEAETGALPQYERPRVRDVTNHWFIVPPDTTDYNNVVYDTTMESYRLQPPFSPFAFEAGLGVNASLFSLRYLESRLLAGIGYRQENRWDESYVGAGLDTSETVVDTCDICRRYREVVRNGWNKTVIRRLEDTRNLPEVGPEASWYATVRIGRIATVESELKVFAPFIRLLQPGIIWRATVSWRLIRMVSLVYDYEYELRRPEETALQKAESKHRVLLRFSYTSR